MDRGTPVFSDDLVSVELEDFRVFERLSVNYHADESDLLVKAAVAGRPRIDVEQVQFIVINDFQDVRMAADV